MKTFKQRWMRHLAVPALGLCALLSGCATTGGAPAVAGVDPTKPTHFTNPLFANGADPWLEFHEGNYYLTTTTWTSQLVMRKSPTLAGLSTATPINIWSFSEFERCCNFWAFEFHRLNGPNGWRWYLMFTSGREGTLDYQHLSVVESAGDDPMGPYEYKGSMMPDTWNIDGTYLEHQGKLYLLWSEWVGDEQRNFISAMSNPWTLTGERMLLTRPELEWEVSGRKVTEAPQILKRDGRTFMIYSASYCDTPDYKLGLLELVGDDPMAPESWRKNPEPVFQRGNGVFAPGHNGFFVSPDGKENWLVYHGNSSEQHGCGATRSVRAQKFTWHEDGTPNFGVPVPEGTPVALPSGENGPLQTGIMGSAYQLVNRNNPSFCVARQQNGSLQGTCENEAAAWVMDYTTDGYFRFANNASGQFLGSCSAEGLAQSPWINHSCQEWKPVHTDNGWWRWQNRQTGQWLTAEQCEGDNCDQWRAQPVGPQVIASVQSGKVLTANACAAGGNIEQQEWKGADCQSWNFNRADEGFFHISPQGNDNLCISVEASSIVTGANMVLGACEGNNSQWRIEHLADGTQQLVARHSNKVADLAHCGLENGTNIAQSENLNTLCQKFQLRNPR